MTTLNRRRGAGRASVAIRGTTTMATSAAACAASESGRVMRERELAPAGERVTEPKRSRGMCIPPCAPAVSPARDREERRSGSERSSVAVIGHQKTRIAPSAPGSSSPTRTSGIVTVLLGHAEPKTARAVRAGGSRAARFIRSVGHPCPGTVAAGSSGLWRGCLSAALRNVS